MKKELFKNEIILTQELNEQYTKASYRRYRRKYRIGLSIFAGIDLVIALLLIFWYHQVPYGIIFGILGVGMLIMVSHGHTGGSNEAYKNLVKSYNGTPRMFATFYEDHMERNTNRGTITVDYEQITSILETQDLYVLMVGKQGAIQQGIILSKVHFRTGNFEAFKKFIHEKCPNLK